MKIPQMFYLRKQTLRAKCTTGYHTITVYVFWNYRLTVQGVVQTPHRARAKHLVLNLHPEAEFYR